MELILHNGHIYTMDNDLPYCEAIAIKDGLIHTCGNNDEVLALSTPNTKIVDLKGKTVIPGLNDSHLHLYSTGLYLNLIDLMGSTTVQEVKERAKAYLNERNITPGTWIRGRGWNQDYFEDEKRFLSRDDLDEITMEHPLILYRTCGHILVANSLAIEQSGFAEDKTISGGSFDLKTGIFKEKAIDVLLESIPDPSLEEIKEMILTGIQYANEQGLTSLQTDDLYHLPSKDYEKMLQAYDELAKERKLTCRIYQQSQLPTFERLQDFIKKNYTTGKGDSFFKIGPLKLLSDGSLGARTAALINPYYDDPSTNGILTYSNEELYSLVELAHTNGMQIAIHAIGDRAMKQVLDTYEKVLKKHPRSNHRHGIVHCQIMDESLMNRMKDFEVLGLVQPIFIHYDHQIVEDRVGPTLAQTSYAFKTMMERGIHLAFGTDSPVEKLNTIDNIYCAVTRRHLKDRSSDGWYPKEKVSVEDTIYAYTVGSAYASFEENLKGQLKPGYFADLTILDQNIFEMNHDNILDIKIDMTIVDGKIVYKRL